MNGNMSAWPPTAPRRASSTARTASSLDPPPAGRIPTPTSGSPMYDSSAATVRSQCKMNSHEPPSAIPRTAATVGTAQERSRIAVRWNLAIIPSIALHCPAATAGPIAERSAPSENGSLVCQITTPAKLRSASSSARWTPSSTDRKSTRLNSSHLGISYAVFCLKKKKITSTIEDKDITIDNGIVKEFKRTSTSVFVMDIKVCEMHLLPAIVQSHSGTPKEDDVKS